MNTPTNRIRALSPEKKSLLAYQLKELGRQSKNRSSENLAALNLEASSGKHFPAPARNASTSVRQNDKILPVSGLPEGQLSLDVESLPPKDVAYLSAHILAVSEISDLAHIPAAATKGHGQSWSYHPRRITPLSRAPEGQVTIDTSVISERMATYLLEAILEAAEIDRLDKIPLTSPRRPDLGYHPNKIQPMSNVESHQVLVDADSLPVNDVAILLANIQQYATSAELAPYLPQGPVSDRGTRGR